MRRDLALARKRNVPRFVATSSGEPRMDSPFLFRLFFFLLGLGLGIFLLAKIEKS